MKQQAIDKLDKEWNECKGLSLKGERVSTMVLEALKEFCRQNSEFAQAVVQSDKPVKDCIESTVKDCDDFIPDIEAYKKAVQFYFAGADIHFVMTIDLGDGGFSNDKSGGVALSLDEFIDF